MKNFILPAVFILSILVAGYYFSSIKPETTEPKADDPVSVQAPNQNKIDKNKKLDLSNKGLDKVPDYVFENKKLEELDISGNNIEGAIQAEIRHNENLKVIKASDNNMTGLPAEIGQLEKLEKLDVANNELTGLPNEIANLKNLKEFDVSGNDVSEVDLKVITDALPDLKVIKENIDDEPVSLEIENKTIAIADCSSGSFNVRFLCLLNEYRKSNSLASLAIDSSLNKVASDHSTWMNDTGTFSHTGKDRSKYYERCNTGGTSCSAENLANGASSPEALLKMWQDSPTHNKNMLGSHTSIGLGSAGAYFTLLMR